MSVFQFKTKLEGRSVAGPDGEYWISPQRDIATNFTVMVKKALIFAAEVKTDPQVKAYHEKVDDAESKLVPVATAMAKFIKLAHDKEYIGKVGVAVADSGLNETDPAAKTIFMYSLAAVAMSAFYKGVAEALSGSFNPYMMMHPDEIYINESSPSNKTS